LQFEPEKVKILRKQQVTYTQQFEIIDKV